MPLCSESSIEVEHFRDVQTSFERLFQEDEKREKEYLFTREQQRRLTSTTEDHEERIARIEEKVT